MTENMIDGDFEKISLADYTESAYLNYAMYVINDRALPHIGAKKPLFLLLNKAQLFI